MQLVEADADELAGVGVEGADAQPILDDAPQQDLEALLVGAPNLGDPKADGQALLERRLYL